MESDSVTVHVVVDAKTFRRFAVFDGLRVKRIWRSPLIFALIMSGSAAACFALRGRSDQAWLLGGVLLTIGLGLPAWHIGAFFRSVGAQIKGFGFKEPKAVYSLTLFRGNGGVTVSKPGSVSVGFKWGEVYRAYRVTDCVYLYAAKNRAFLLPDGQSGGSDPWLLISEMLPAEKIKVCK